MGRSSPSASRVPEAYSPQPSQSPWLQRSAQSPVMRYSSFSVCAQISLCPTPTPCSHHSSWKPSRSRRRSTSAYRTTLIGSSWPSWRQTHPSWRSNRAAEPNLGWLRTPPASRVPRYTIRSQDQQAPGLPNPGCAGPLGSGKERKKGNLWD